MKPYLSIILGTIGGSFVFSDCHAKPIEEGRRPNILIAISDDQSVNHTSFAGCKYVNTPGFDRVAKNGVYFTNCIAGSPGCAPSRSALITGRHHWQNEQSGQHASSWMKKYVPFVDLLKNAGYHTGHTGKGVGPFQFARTDADSLWRKENPAGKHFNSIQYLKGDTTDERTTTGIGTSNYSENFKSFVKQRQAGQPFCFWYGATEPHRGYEEGSWKRNGKKTTLVDVPGFLPDNEIVRGDILDYAVEIEWFDLHLTRMLNYLDSIGELSNTIVIVTGDNGMSFPRAKANCYEYGIHVPMAISYPKGFNGNRIVEDPVGFADLAPTILEMTGTSQKGMLSISGQSIAHILKSNQSGIVDQTKKYVFSGRERHSYSRYNNLGYPQRAIRSTQYLFIWNVKPQRWPAGDPQAVIDEKTGRIAPLYGIDENSKYHSGWAFTDIDPCPTNSFMIENAKNASIQKFFDLAYNIRPEFELYDIVADPSCLQNLYSNQDYKKTVQTMKAELMKELNRTKDPRVVGHDPGVFDTYLRYSPLRVFPKPKKMSSTY
jgi:uncharacterized sulfatase